MYLVYFNYLADVLSKVSVRFRRLVTDPSFCNASHGVLITAGGAPEKEL